MAFADIHTHILWGVDDGAKTQEQMEQMVDRAYADGTRQLCLTPHFHPGYFGQNQKKTAEAFEQLRRFAAAKYPDLRLYLANELRYDRNCISWLDEGLCRTINATPYVLVDFSEGERGRVITGGLERLLNAGYVPVLAHIERYRELRDQLNVIQSLRSKGVLIQITAGSLNGTFGLQAKWYAKRLLKHHLVDFIATDAHNMTHRGPEISGAYQYIRRKYGTGYADAVCSRNAQALLADGTERKE